MKIKNSNIQKWKWVVEMKNSTHYWNNKFNPVGERIREIEYIAEKITQNIYKGTVQLISTY